MYDSIINIMPQSENRNEKALCFNRDINGEIGLIELFNMESNVCMFINLAISTNSRILLGLCHEFQIFYPNNAIHMYIMIVVTVTVESYIGYTFTPCVRSVTCPA